ncbi:MAG TPA: type II secretion system protein GspM [Rhodocyclaceae bacterium]|nr:type II secretion system protein GspM [Rhodocyclaceae bacterium]
MRTFWQARAPLERRVIAALAVVVAVALYLALLQSASQARLRLGRSVTSLQEQARRLDRDAAELQRLRALPAAAASTTDLRTLVAAQAGAAGLTHALQSIEAPDADQVQVAFGAVAFVDWLNWAAGLQALHVRLGACRIEALTTPGLVSVTATLVRARGR